MNTNGFEIHSITLCSCWFTQNIGSLLPPPYSYGCINNPWYFEANMMKTVVMCILGSINLWGLYGSLLSSESL